MEALEHLSSAQVVALCVLVAVVAWAFAHFGLAKKIEAAVTVAKADAAKITTRVESYTDDEIVKLTGSMIARLADTSAEMQTKSDADAAMARKAQLLARVQSVVAAAKPSA